MAADKAKFQEKVEEFAKNKAQFLAEVAASKTEVAASKAEVAASKAEVAAIKAELAASKTELAASKTELAASKAQLQKERNDLTALKAKLMNVLQAPQAQAECVTIHDSDSEDDSEDEEIKAIEYTYKGKTYWRGVTDNSVYDPKSQERVGTWDAGCNEIIFETDSEADADA